MAIVALIGLVVCTNVANVVWAAWIEDDPEAVMALSSRNRYLVLAVAAGISPLAYVVIATVRLAAAFAVCHLIGRAYRDNAYRFFTKYLGMTSENIRQLEDFSARAQWVIVPVFIGSNIVAAITGVERWPVRRLAGLFAVGLAARLALIWWLAQAFERPLTDILEFISRYQWWVVAASIVVVFAVNARNARRGGR
ncbi:MAG: hypothetical protein M3349_09505 [Actinomycetota bacterium]|nr:hypothetical protein [Actinomycetota bacterium]